MIARYTSFWTDDHQRTWPSDAGDDFMEQSNEDARMSTQTVDGCYWTEVDPAQPGYYWVQYYEFTTGRNKTVVDIAFFNGLKWNTMNEKTSISPHAWVKIDEPSINAPYTKFRGIIYHPVEGTDDL